MSSSTPSTQAVSTTFMVISLVAACGGKATPGPEAESGGLTADTSGQSAATAQAESDVSVAGSSSGNGTSSQSQASQVDNSSQPGVAGRPAAAGGAPSGSSGSHAVGAANAAAGSTSAGAPSGGDSSVPATFETVKLVITQAPCFGAGCHNDEQNPLDLRMDEELYTRMTSRVSSNCGDIPVVNPGKPQQSALVKILRGPCGPTPRMPLGCEQGDESGCVPDEYISAIERWIAAGAPPQE